MKPTLLILAAGMGSRYGGLKQMDELGPSGETLIDYSVYDAAKAGFGKVVFVIRKEFESDFKAKISDKYRDSIEVEHVFQAIDTPVQGVDISANREKPWGTGHAVLVAENAIKEPFAVINADDYYGVSGFQSMADFLISQVKEDHYSMVGYILENTLSENGTVSRGVCQTDSNQYLMDVVERTKIGKENGKVLYWDNDLPVELNPQSKVSMNFWGFHPNIFEYIKGSFIEFATENIENPRAEFYIPLFVNKMLKSDLMKMTVLESNDNWFGVTYKEDKEMVVKAFNDLHESGKYPNPLW